MCFDTPLYKKRERYSVGRLRRSLVWFVWFVCSVSLSAHAESASGAALRLGGFGFGALRFGLLRCFGSSGGRRGGLDAGGASGGGAS